jgi:hypothetical protein
MILITLILAAAIGLGLYLGRLYLRGQRRRGLVVVHLLLGAAGAEQVVVQLQGAHGGSMGFNAAILLGITLALGFLASLVEKSSPQRARYVLATHATAGLAGFALFLAWASTV